MSCSTSRKGQLKRPPPDDGPDDKDDGMPLQNASAASAGSNTMSSSTGRKGQLKRPPPDDDGLDDKHDGMPPPFARAASAALARAASAGNNTKNKRAASAAFARAASAGNNTKNKRAAGPDSDETLQFYYFCMWPAREIEDPAEIQRLKNLLDSQFMSNFEDSESEEEEEEGGYNYACAHANQLQFMQDHGGLQWINALYQFDGNIPVWETPLHYVLQNVERDEANVVALLEMKADANIRDSMGRPPLTVFLNGVEPQWDVLDALLEAGANVSASYQNQTILERARADAERDASDPNRQLLFDAIQEWHEKLRDS